MNALDEVVHLGMNTVISEVVPLDEYNIWGSSFGMNSLNEVVHLGMNTIDKVIPEANAWSLPV